MIHNSAGSAARIEDVSDEELNEACWSAGETGHILAPEQRCLRNLVLRRPYDDDGNPLEVLPSHVKRVVAQWSRRWGKSTTAQNIGDTICRKTPFRNVIHAFPTADTATKVTRDNARALFKTCPPHLTPRWRVQGGFFEYHTGSRYYVRGLETESDIENTLGMAADLIIFDEAGFIRYLDYAIKCLAPMMLGREGSLMLFVSSRARDPFHTFFVELDKAEAQGAALVRTIHQSSRYSVREIAEMAKDCGGEDSLEWRADYLCERIVDTDFAILPEFTTQRDEVVMGWPRPEYFNSVVGLDLGWHPDFTFGVVGYYDFANAMIVIEDEFEISQMTTDVMAAQLAACEQRAFAEYWADQNKLHPPQIMTRDGKVRTVRGPTYHLRMQDVDKQIQADLSILHNLPINQAYNQDPKSQVNRVRLAIRQGRLKINPRCKRLVAHCSAGLWNKNRTSFERVPGFGHFDGVSALCIAVAHCDVTTNPFPEIPVSMKRQDVVDLRYRKPPSGPFQPVRRRR